MVELYQVLESKENITDSNPYHINAPVTGSQFYGRQALLSSVLEMLATTSEHAALIFGPACFGKTTFLQELMTRLPGQAYVPVYWGVKDQADLSSPAGWTMLAQTIAGQARLPMSKLPADFDEFRTRFLPQVYKKIAPRRLVLLLDDIDLLLDSTAETDSFGQKLQQLLAQQQALTLVLSTGKKIEALPLALQNIAPPLRYEELPPLTSQETYLLIIEQGRFLPVGFLAKTIDRIWDLTAGHPYYINLICHETLDYVLQEDIKKIDPELLRAVLPFILDKSGPDFDKASAPLSSSAFETLTASAAAVWQELPITSEAVSQILAQNHKTIEENALSQAFNELETQSILKQEAAGGYNFVVPLMAHWLFVRYLAQTPIEPGPTQAARPRWSQPRWLALVGSGALILLVALIGFAALMTNNTLATTSATSAGVGLAASSESFTAQPTVTLIATERPVSTPLPTPTLVPTTVEISALLPTTTPTLALTAIVTVVPTLAPSPTATPLPTFTAAPTATSVPTLPPPTATSVPTLPSPTATPLASVPSPTTPAPPTPVTSLPAGSFTLLNPLALDQPSYGLTEFEWQWTGSVPSGTGFEVRVWREGEPQMGVHDAVYDNQHGAIESLGENKYRLRVDITGAAGVQGVRGEYWWTVALVQISPSYADLGQQAPPARMRFEPKNSGGDGGGGDGGSSGGVGIN